MLICEASKDAARPARAPGRRITALFPADGSGRSSSRAEPAHDARGPLPMCSGWSARAGSRERQGWSWISSPGSIGRVRRRGRPVALARLGTSPGPGSPGDDGGRGQASTVVFAGQGVRSGFHGLPVHCRSAATRLESSGLSLPTSRRYTRGGYGSRAIRRPRAMSNKRRRAAPSGQAIEGSGSGAGTRDRGGHGMRVMPGRRQENSPKSFTPS